MIIKILFWILLATSLGVSIWALIRSKQDYPNISRAGSTSAEPVVSQSIVPVASKFIQIPSGAEWKQDWIDYVKAVYGNIDDAWSEGVPSTLMYCFYTADVQIPREALLLIGSDYPWMPEGSWPDNTGVGFVKSCPLCPNVTKVPYPESNASGQDDSGSEYTIDPNGYGITYADCGDPPPGQLSRGESPGCADGNAGCFRAGQTECGGDDFCDASIANCLGVCNDEGTNKWIPSSTWEGSWDPSSDSTIKNQTYPGGRGYIDDEKYPYQAMYCAAPMYQTVMHEFMVATNNNPNDPIQARIGNDAPNAGDTGCSLIQRSQRGQWDNAEHGCGQMFLRNLYPPDDPKKFVFAEGFEDNANVEVSHLPTKYPFGKESYNLWYFIGSGTGVFYNLGKTLRSYNKLDGYARLWMEASKNPDLYMNEESPIRQCSAYFAGGFDAEAGLSKVESFPWPTETLTEDNIDLWLVRVFGDCGMSPSPACPELTNPRALSWTTEVQPIDGGTFADFVQYYVSDLFPNGPVDAMKALRTADFAQFSGDDLIKFREMYGIYRDGFGWYDDLDNNNSCIAAILGYDTIQYTIKYQVQGVYTIEMNEVRLFLNPSTGEINNPSYTNIGCPSTSAEKTSGITFTTGVNGKQSCDCNLTGWCTNCGGTTPLNTICKNVPECTADNCTSPSPCDAQTAQYPGWGEACEAVGCKYDDETWECSKS